MSMLKSETATLLGIAAGTDNRQVGEVAIESWHAIITQALGEQVRFEDCRWALVEHYGQNPGAYAQPGHVVELVQKLRKTRRAKIPMPNPPAELCDESGYPDRASRENADRLREWEKGVRAQIENGLYAPDPPPDVVRRSIREVETSNNLWRDIREMWPVDERPALESSS